MQRKGRAQDTPTPPRHRRRWPLRFIGTTLLFIVVLLFAARAALPGWIQNYVNRTLDQSPDYSGSVGEIDVHLWRGAYTIHDLRIVKREHSVPVPFVEARRVDLSIYWSALRQGFVRGKVVMDRPRLNFTHGPTEEQTQTGVDQPWLGMLDDLFPFRIDRAEIVEGEIHFHALGVNPPVDVFLSDVNASVENLTNIEDSTDPVSARVRARATAMESGRFTLRIDLDPNAHRPAFTLATRLLDLDVTRVNPLARAYADFDFEAGQFDFVMEASSRHGFLQGYAKPLFRGLRVLSLRGDLKTDDPLQLFWEALVGAVTEVFKNQGRDQFGTRIAFEGELENPRTNILDIIGNVLRNAFIEALMPRLERRQRPEFERDGLRMRAGVPEPEKETQQ